MLPPLRDSVFEVAVGGPGVKTRGVDLVRIRLADGSPVCLEHAKLPARRFPGLLEPRLGGSVYELIQDHFDTRPAAATERIEVVLASADEAAIPDVEPGPPLMALTRTSTDGEPIEFSRDPFRAGRIQIIVRAEGSWAAPAMPSPAARGSSNCALSGCMTPMSRPADG